MIQCFDQLEKISKMERTQFLCNDCGKDFVDSVKLGVHKYNMHTEKPFECAQCGERGSGVAKFKNHMRKHRSQNNVSKCDSCDFETPHAGNLKRHVKLHTAVKPKKSKSIKTCEPCGKTFDRKDSFDRHMKVHLKESAQTFGCTQCDEKFKRKDFLVKHQNTVHTDQVQSEFGFGAFQKEKKVKKKKTFMCDKCAKTFHSEAHIKRHFLTTSHTNRQKKQGSSRWKVMRHVKKLLKDTQYANELKKQTKGVETGNVDGSVVEAIMSQIPNMSNRNILRTLTILRKKLPKSEFKANLRQVIQQRTNLLDDLFETNFAEVLDSKGNEIKMPITNAKDLNTLILLICEKRGLDPDTVKLCLGVDGGQSKLIATLAIVPPDELGKKERLSQPNVKDRSKSTSVKRCLVVARVDSVPENYTNVTILMSKLNLPALRKDFCVVADLKLVDIMVGIQSTSSMHPCPYCDGYKVDKTGKKTNQKGTFVKGSKRTGRTLQTDFESYNSLGRSDRKQLMNFNSVEFPPLYIHEGQEDMDVIQLYPPPVLHTGILGPGNDCLTQLEGYFPQEMEAFYSEHHIKSSGPGGQYNGPTIKKILQNHQGKLDQLANIVSKGGDDFKFFIQHLKNLGNLHHAVNLKVLDTELVDRTIEAFESTFAQLQEKFDLSMPLKVHIIKSHYREYFEATGKTFLTVSDEVTESMHSAIRLFEDCHRYVNKKKGSKSHALMQHRSVVHLNSINCD